MFAEPDADDPELIYPHLFPAADADLFVLLPATADMIAKIACGYGDDLISASVLGLPSHCLRFFCPAMNTRMWDQLTTRDNVAALQTAGWHAIGPDAGALACGTEGAGRMVDPEVIIDCLDTALASRRSMEGKTLLILSGPTHEHLDPVRYIGNASSGKMGKALAEAALRRGATVDFVSGPVHEQERPAGPGLTVYPVTSAAEMLEAGKRLFDRADAAVFVAAVADYAPEQREAGKKPKSAEGFALKLRPTPDIAAELCSSKRADQVTIGFALQADDDAERARGKLESKHLDLLLHNPLDAMGETVSAYRLFRRDDTNVEDWGTLTKKACAEQLIEQTAQLLTQRRAKGSTS
jgi:phosphopantothenoylcysteine decarboxylase/phosphopantothenate--cysteine ligase